MKPHRDGYLRATPQVPLARSSCRASGDGSPATAPDRMSIPDEVQDDRARGQGGLRAHVALDRREHRPRTRSAVAVFAAAPMRRLLLITSALVLVSIPGRAWAAAPGLRSESRAQDETRAPTNEWCPVLTDERVDPEVHTEYEGATVAFCCRKCLHQFEADPDAYAANLPADLISQAHQMQPGLKSDPDGEASRRGTDSEHAADLHEHDHSSHAGASASGIAVAVERIGRLHPMIVHFPIALLLAAALPERLSAWRRSSHLAFAARFCLWLGALGAIAAAALGWADAFGVGDGYTGAAAALLEYHRWAGTLTAFVSMLAVVAWERADRRQSVSPSRIQRFLLWCAAGLVALTGHFGASLIFGWDYLWR